MSLLKLFEHNGIFTRLRMYGTQLRGSLSSSSLKYLHEVVFFRSACNFFVNPRKTHELSISLNTSTVNNNHKQLPQLCFFRDLNEQVKCHYVALNETSQGAQSLHIRPSRNVRRHWQTERHSIALPMRAMACGEEQVKNRTGKWRPYHPPVQRFEDFYSALPWYDLKPPSYKMTKIVI